MVLAATFLAYLFSVCKKFRELQDGGDAIAKICGAVSLETSNHPAKRVLKNVVDEMAIATCTPSPPIYVLDSESRINAFVAGIDRGSTIMVVTRGALDKLNRSELQGMVAHEFSHILNGDVALSTNMIALIFGLSSIAELGNFIFPRDLSKLNHSQSENSGWLIAFGLIPAAAFWFLGSIGRLAALLLQACLGRKRELLADAAAVHFTRDASGLAGALKKIAGFSSNSFVAMQGSRQLNHLMLANPLLMPNLFDSHPPLLLRIKRLDPQFKGTIEELQSFDYTTPESALSFTSDIKQSSHEQEGELSPVIAAAAQSKDRLSLDDIPAILLEQAGTVNGAVALVYSMLLSLETSTREKQLMLLSAPEDQFVYNEVRCISESLKTLPATLRFPLVCLSIAALRNLGAPAYNHFRKRMRELIEADNHLDFFEFTLSKLISGNLDSYFQQKTTKHGRLSQKELIQACRLLMSAMSDFSSSRVDAFKCGAASLGFSGLPVTDEQIGFEQMDKALDKLSGCSQMFKARFVEALSAIAHFDGVILMEEYQLLLAVSSILGCPPLLQLSELHN